MAVNVLPPSPAAPVREGYVRHQFVLIIDDQKFQSLLNQTEGVEVSGVSDFLISNFGSAVLYAEKVMSGDFHAWHVWADYLIEEEAKYFPDKT